MIAHTLRSNVVHKKRLAGSSCAVLTPCVHFIYRCPEEVEKSQKLACKRDQEGRIKTMIETRGEDGYILAPGSPPCCDFQSSFSKTGHLCASALCPHHSWGAITQFVLAIDLLKRRWSSFRFSSAFVKWYFPVSMICLRTSRDSAGPYSRRRSRAPSSRRSC